MELGEQDEDSKNNGGLCLGDKEAPSPFLNVKYGEEDQEYKNKNPPPRPPGHQEECDEGYRKQNITLANLALAHFNKENDTKYELVEDETMDSNPFLECRGLWTHCCFSAKDSKDSSIRQFFAEIHRRDGLIWVVTTCKILIGETQAGCVLCGSFIVHPVDRYLAGVYSDYNSPALQEEKLEIEKKARLYMRNFSYVFSP